MNLRFAVVAFALLGGVLGCSSDPGKRTEPVDVTGIATKADGKPVANVTISFCPTDASQMPATFSLKADGKFAVKLSPGKYTYSFDGNPAALQAVPVAYHNNDASHTVEVPATGGEIKVTLS